MVCLFHLNSNIISIDTILTTSILTILGILPDSGENKRCEKSSAKNMWVWIDSAQNKRTNLC